MLKYKKTLAAIIIGLATALDYLGYLPTGVIQKLIELFAS